MRIETLAASVGLTLLGTMALAQTVTYEYVRTANRNSGAGQDHDGGRHPARAWTATRSVKLEEGGQ